LGEEGEDGSFERGMKGRLKKGENVEEDEEEEESSPFPF